MGFAPVPRRLTDFAQALALAAPQRHGRIARTVGHLLRQGHEHHAHLRAEIHHDTSNRAPRMAVKTGSVITTRNVLWLFARPSRRQRTSLVRSPIFPAERHTG